MAQKIRGNDKRALTALQHVFASIAARDARLESDNPRGKSIFFPTADTTLQANRTAVLARITALLAQ